MELGSRVRAAGSAGERAASTEAEYERRVRRFLGWVASKKLDADWRGLAIAYEALCRHLKPASRRKYRAALRFWIERHMTLSAERLFSAEAAAIDLRWRRAKAAEGPPKRRSGGLLRTMPMEVRVLVSRELYSFGTVYALVAGDLVLATAVVGLRPGEWADAELEGDRLRVRNAKYRPGERGNGVERTLIIARECMTQDESDAISRLVRWMTGRDWNAVRVKVSPLLKRALGNLVGRGDIPPKWKRLRLYDARHQFASEAKAGLDASTGEVAAAMGHASAMTAVHHYGRRKRAQRPVAVRPSPESVAGVKEVTIQRLQRIAQRNAAARQVAADPAPPANQLQGEVTPEPNAP